MQVAVITGASNGIGYALAKGCLQRGMHVVLADIDPCLTQNAEKLSDYQAQILPVYCDVTDKNTVEDLAKMTLSTFGRVDLLFNNAGISGTLAPLWTLSTQEIERVLAVNVYGIVHSLQAFLPRLFEQTHTAHVINMASIYGVCSGSQMSAYAMSKHAVIALSESLHYDLMRMKKNVAVSIACPAFVDTELVARANPQDPLHAMVSEFMKLSQPVDDVANAILEGVNKKNFYILPDETVVDYAMRRVTAMQEITSPARHPLEKLMGSLSRRVANQ